MKRQVLIVGYANGLTGVKADLDNYYRFFTSPVGGMWRADEICVLENASTDEFLRHINFYQVADLDYFVFVFCGHGASLQDEVVMEINDTDRPIKESEVTNVASRQLNIFDCCRKVESDVPYDILAEVRNFSQGGKIYGNVRQRYDWRIMQAVEQSASLYACSSGESAIGRNRGGDYSYHLLKAARNVSDAEEYKTISLCHYEACQHLEAMGSTQHPDYKLPRCVANQSLILSIHP